MDKFLPKNLDIHYICPFCNSSVPQTPDTYRELECYFNVDCNHYVTDSTTNTSIVDLNLLYCPTCKEVSIKATGREHLEGLSIPLYPKSLAKQFPKYIPKAIRNDYEEAYSISTLSPKASATLSRRCLQGMIRDFWNIHKNRLIDEIDALQSRIPVSQWNAINALRKIGNIGAHMEQDVNTIVDVEPDEAQKLLKLIELLIEKWYINRHDEEQLLSDITSIANDKNSQKQYKSNN